MNKSIYLFLLLCLLIFCGQKQDEVEIIIEDGVEVVLNHLEPYKIKGETGNLVLKEQFTIDTEKDEIAAIGLSDISGFDVDSDGNIYFRFISEEACCIRYKLQFGQRDSHHYGNNAGKEKISHN